MGPYNSFLDSSSTMLWGSLTLPPGASGLLLAELGIVLSVYCPVAHLCWPAALKDG